MRIVVSIILVLSVALNVSAGPKVYDFNARCEQAYDAIMQLRINAGKALLEAEKKEHPDNLMPYFLDDYADFFPLFFNEDPSEYSRKRNMRGFRLDKMAEGSPDSPYYLYTQAAIKFHWAMVKVKFNEKWDAAWEVRKAYMTLKENQRRFPDFMPNKMLLGAMQTVFGTIPEGYKWITNILGMKGSIKDGMGNVNDFIESSAPEARYFREESYYYYCYLTLFVVNKPEDTWQFLQRKQLDTKNNYLFALMVANLSMNNQKAANGIRVLQERNDSGDYADIQYYNYVYGLLKLTRLDDDAHVYLERFINNFKGKFYLKECLQRLSWYYYLEGNQGAANKYREMILSKGGTETDADKQALKEAQSGRWPNAFLLKVRLLSDGGYFSDALKLLLTKKAADFDAMDEKLEYAYRLGRIYDETGQDDKAIQMYDVTVKVGANRPEYYAARASLQMGMIYEKRNEKAKAVQCYQRCMDMKGHDYKNSLDARAKAGIQRISGS
ncbi:lipopolysaccharide assembly protein LapB [Chitinophaga sp. sic0106]|uniref:tetratricopeptide repeat protein n=1 Tax=Chitinophaga sp. sic0106 TaxID=2854785 RepID=UPI001C493B90|nr:tetratricopeptide repeat protein [Chitinophaga sp. sic0106]MBV7533422.1 tetratricopeptide repeat protein [Chitinophaga sp. sic0106]